MIRPLLEKIFEVMGDKPWIAGQNLTWLDFYFAELLDLLNTISDGLFNTEFPTMQAYWERFIALPNLADAWEDDTKCMKSPFNKKMAKEGQGISDINFSVFRVLRLKMIH